jgi:serine protease AprX
MVITKHKRFLLIIFLLVLSFGFSFEGNRVASAAVWQIKVDRWVLQQSRVETGEEVEFLIFLTEQADLSPAESLKTKEEKGEFVFQTLIETANRSQASLVQVLERQGANYRPYWVANMIWVRGEAALVQEMALRPDVLRVYANPMAQASVLDTEYTPVSQTAPQSVLWNVSQVGAPIVWAYGYTGQGVVIGGQDTGYEWTHPALINQYRGWDGENADHDFNWHDAIHANDPKTPPGNPCGFDSAEPCDDHNHGTHTMGTMVGDDLDGNQIGVAPRASWIGCRNMEQGWGTPASYSECFEWFIAPYPVGSDSSAGDPGKAPHVINNSWGCPPEEGCTDPNIMLTVVENVRAAGIVIVSSAGNSGPACSTILDPAAIYDAVFTVGATNAQGQIASFSSRGPVNIDGSGRIKPDVTAPGVGILSSIRGGSYLAFNGTSMAAPHVTGVIALLISANPGLAGQVDEIEALVRRSATHLTSGETCGGIQGVEIPNNTYGWGGVNAWAAVSEPLDKIYLPMIFQD